MKQRFKKNLLYKRERINYFKTYKSLKFYLKRKKIT